VEKSFLFYFFFCKFDRSQKASFLGTAAFCDSPPENLPQIFSNLMEL
jgi:hypothetical protein